LLLLLLLLKKASAIAATITPTPPSPSRRPRVESKSFDQLGKQLLLVQSFQTCLGFRAPVRVSLTFRVLKNLRDKCFFTLSSFLGFFFHCFLFWYFYLKF
jgi:hypothetical protein